MNRWSEPISRVAARWIGLAILSGCGGTSAAPPATGAAGDAMGTNRGEDGAALVDVVTASDSVPASDSGGSGGNVASLDAASSGTGGAGTTPAGGPRVTVAAA